MKRFNRSVAAALVAAALAAPAVHARPIIERDVAPTSWSTTAAAKSSPSPASAPVVVRTVDTGFDWGSAAIGAGAASALVLLVSLGGLARTSRNRVRVAR